MTCGSSKTALCHTAKATIDVLHGKFEGSVISPRGNVNWPQKSCNLTIQDLFLWGFLKSQIYANKPLTTNNLKININ